MTVMWSGVPCRRLVRLAASDSASVPTYPATFWKCPMRKATARKATQAAMVMAISTGRVAHGTRRRRTRASVTAARKKGGSWGGCRRAAAPRRGPRGERTPLPQPVEAALLHRPGRFGQLPMSQPTQQHRHDDQEEQEAERLRGEVRSEE